MPASRDPIRSAPVVRIVEPGRVPLLLVVAHPIEIGRACSGLNLSDPTLSRRHLVLAAPEGQALVSDLGTTNGSTLDGQPLRDLHRLELGQSVEFGRCRVTLVLPGTAHPNGRTPGVAGTETPASAVARLAGAARAGPCALASDPVAGTTTVVFTTLDDPSGRSGAEWADAVARPRSIVQRMLLRHEATEVMAADDAFLFRFRSPWSAVAYLGDLRGALSSHGAAEPLYGGQLRAGLHTAEVTRDGDADHRRLLSLAARLCEQARGDEVLVSSIVREVLRSRPDVRFGPSRALPPTALGPGHLAHPVQW